MNSTTRPLALVTGASSGIGAAIARELARTGHDLVLTGRNAVALEAVAGESGVLGATATVITHDLSPPGSAATLADRLAARGLVIEVLINNAGLGATGHFDRQDPARIGDILQVNIVALTELTRLLLPAMIARGRGRVMLVASTASFLPGPRMALYFASKAFVRSLGEAIAHELRGTGVTLTVLCPGATDTAFFAVAGAENSIMGRRFRRMMSPDTVARIGCDALAAGRPLVVTGLANRLLAVFARHAPHRLTLPITERLMRED